MKAFSVAVVLLASVAFCSECAEFTTKDGVTYKKAKLVKVEKKTSNSYFKIVHEEGSKLVNPVDIKPFEITLADGTVLQKIKIMDISSDGISVFDSKSVKTIKFKDISPESREMFEYDTGKVPPKETPQEEDSDEANAEEQPAKVEKTRNKPAPEAEPETAPEVKPAKSKNKLMKMKKDTE